MSRDVDGSELRKTGLPLPLPLLLPYQTNSDCGERQSRRVEESTLVPTYQSHRAIYHHPHIHDFAFEFSHSSIEKVKLPYPLSQPYFPRSSHTTCPWHHQHSICSFLSLSLRDRSFTCTILQCSINIFFHAPLPPQRFHAFPSFFD